MAIDELENTIAGPGRGLQLWFWMLLGLGVVAVATAVRWAHSSGAVDDDTNGEILAGLAICAGCAGIAFFVAAAAVAHRLGVRRAMRDIDEAIVLDR